MFVGCVNLVLCQALNHWICERTSGTAGGGFGLTWSRISIQNSASCGSRSRMNALPSLDDKILARVRIDSASSVDARAFFHSLLKSVTIAFTREDDGDGGRGAGNSWGVGALRSCHEETRSIQSCRVLKACTSAVAAEIPIQSGPNSRMHVSAELWRTSRSNTYKQSAFGSGLVTHPMSAINDTGEDDSAICQRFISGGRASTETTPVHQPIGLPHQLLIQEHDFPPELRLLGRGRITCKRASEFSSTTFHFPPSQSDGANYKERAGFDRLLTGMLIGVSGSRFNIQRLKMR